MTANTLLDRKPPVGRWDTPLPCTKCPQQMIKHSSVYYQRLRATFLPVSSLEEELANATRVSTPT